MAHIATHDTSFGAGTISVRRWFAAIGRAFVRMSIPHARMNQVQALQKLSNEQLAERGLRREDIARHVFRDVLWS